MIYLDSAATTFQKPLSVSYAMQRAMRTAAARQLGARAQHPRADARTVQDLHHLLGVCDGACDQ